MMKVLVSALAVTAVAGFAPSQKVAPKSSLSETKDDLGVLAKELNPVVGFYDPIGLSDQEFWGTSSEATIGFIREAEVKVMIEIDFSSRRFFIGFVLILCIDFFGSFGSFRKP